MSVRDVAAHRFRDTLAASSDDDIAQLWEIRDTLAKPPVAEILAGLLLTEMADRGMAAPAEPTAGRDAQIVAAITAGEPAKDVAAHHGLSAGHVRRLAAAARGSRTPALRVVERDELRHAEEAITEARTDDHGWPLAIPDQRVTINPGDPIPKPPAPDVFGLIHSDKINYIAGDKETGKTWFAADCMAYMVKTLAKRCVWIDAEDSDNKLASTLAALGHADITGSVLWRRVDWGDWIAADELDRAAIARWLTAGGNGGHLFIDSGSATDSGDSAETFARWKPRHLVHPAATIIEHVSKDPERRHGPAGSLRKGATASGSVLMFEGAPWTPAISGTITVRKDKERPGGITVPKGEICAQIVGTPHADGRLTLEVRPPPIASETYRALIIAAVEDDPGIQSTKLRDAVTEAAKDVGLRTDWQTIAKEIADAIAAGDVVKIAGKGKNQHNYPRGAIPNP